MGDAELSSVKQQKLQQDLDSLQSMLVTVFQLFNSCLQLYSETMHNALNQVKYFSAEALMQTHENARNQAITQVWTFKIRLDKECVSFKLILALNSKFHSQAADNELKAALQVKIDANIQERYSQFEAANVEKRRVSTRKNGTFRDSSN